MDENKPEESPKPEPKEGEDNPQKPEESDEEEYMEVAKPTRNVYIGLDDKDEETIRREIQRKKTPPLNQKSSFKKKHSAVEKQKPKSALELKKERIAAKTDNLVRKYKTLNRPNYSDTEASKFRFQQKQKLFQTLLYGIEELRQLDPEMLTDDEKDLLSLEDLGLYSVVKSIVIEIDVQFLNILNNSNKQMVSKAFKEQWRQLNINLQDQDNFPLRRKIAAKAWNTREMATCPQADFYSEARKRRIRQESERLLNQARVIQFVPVYQVEQEPEIEYGNTYRTTNKNFEQTRKKEGYKYLNSSTMALLKDLTSNEKINRMRSLLEDGVRKQIGQSLIKNLDKILGGKTQNN